jgi:hypothetical protein
LLFIIFINDICNIIKYSQYLLFADDIKIFQPIKSPYDCSLLESDIDSVQSWCTANFMKLNISKTRVISFSRKINTLLFHYKLCNSSITRTDSIKDLGVYLIGNCICMIMLTTYFLNVSGRWVLFGL